MPCPVSHQEQLRRHIGTKARASTGLCEGLEHRPVSFQQPGPNFVWSASGCGAQRCDSSRGRGGAAAMHGVTMVGTVGAEAHQLASINAARVVEVQAVKGALQVLTPLVHVVAELVIVHPACRRQLHGADPCMQTARGTGEVALGSGASGGVNGLARTVMVLIVLLHHGLEVLGAAWQAQAVQSSLPTELMSMVLSDSKGLAPVMEPDRPASCWRGHQLAVRLQMPPLCSSAVAAEYYTQALCSC